MAAGRLPRLARLAGVPRGTTTPTTAAVESAASNALPPARILSPACVASGELVATIPPEANTEERCSKSRIATDPSGIDRVALLHDQQIARHRWQ